MARYQGLDTISSENQICRPIRECRIQIAQFMLHIIPMVLVKEVVFVYLHPM